MEIRQTFVAGFLLALCLGAAVTGISPAAQVYSSPIVGLVQTVNSITAQLLGTYGSATSTNWAGYVVTGATNSVTDVKGSWIVPSIQQGCTSTNTYSLAWIGIDGYTDGTVEQIGTASTCSSGAPKYYAWYETYPKPLSQISNLVITPGDKISAEVSYAGSKFTMTLKDLTTGKSYSNSFTVNGANRSSAEWIMEAPTSTGTTVLPLANFGVSNHGQDYTSISSTGYATIGGKAGTIASFGASVVQVVMQGGSTVKAQPSSLTNDGTSFTVTWKSQ